jgi:HlyD family secretion protein
MRYVVTLGVLLALGGGGWFGYQRWWAAPEEITYKTAEVRRGAVTATVSATGTVQPLLKVLVGSQISGTVMHWYADFNQRVVKDFVLAELDRDRLKAALDQRTAAVAVARAQIEENRAKLATATLDRERIAAAMARAAASDFELRAAQATETAALAAVRAAEAQLEAAEADRRQASIELDKTVIRAPIDGVVISRDIDEGQTVAASLSAPTLFTIANDLTKMRVEAAVSETEIGRISEGMPAAFRVDAFPDMRFRGTVSQVRFKETVVDNVVTYTTLVDVDNPDMLLRPGMTATILFEVAKVEDVLLVPNAALRFNPDYKPAEINFMRPGKGQAAKPRVFLPGEGKLVEVAVQPGLSDGQVTEIKGGELEVGTRVVVEQETHGKPRAAGGPQQRMPRF